MRGSPRSEQFDDIYFAVEDGLEETKHVFLAGNGLPERWQGRDRFVIGETGFGTGLNFLSAWMAFEATKAPGQKLQFISFEKYPLSATQIAEYLGVWRDQLGSYLDRLVEAYPLRVTGWHSIQLTPQVSLLLIFDDVNRAMPELEARVDAWFLDGHAPAKNPDMWSATVFAGLARNAAPDASFATFTAAGLVKRGLREVGFTVEKRRGFGRKRDMLVGRFAGEGVPERSGCAVSSVAVIGAGIAGTAVADALTRRGLHVDLYDRSGVAAEASGNPRGLYNPRISARLGVETDFYGSAFALAVRGLKTLKDIGYHPCGTLHLLTDDDKRRKWMGFLSESGWHRDHAHMLTATEASERAGIVLAHDAVFLPDAGSVSPVRLCHQLAQGKTVYQEDVPSLLRTDAGWNVNGRVYDAVVISNGAGCLAYDQTKHLPLGTVRGQITCAHATPSSEALKVNLCYGGYCSAAINGLHVLGATFQPWLTDTALRDEDDRQIIAQIEQAAPTLAGQFSPENSRAALRTAAKDRVPVIGPVDGCEGLYVSTAHGSHGLLSGLLGAEIIAADITGDTPPLSRAALRHISPQRFVERARRLAG